MVLKSGLLAVDVDGTLITDHGHITDEVYDALQRAVDANWEIVIASGRTFHAAEVVLDQLPFVRYAVLSNGACIMDVRENHIMAMHSLDVPALEHAITAMRSHGVIPALYNTDMKHQSVYYDTLDGACEFFEWYVNNDTRSQRVDDVLAVQDDILQIGAIAEKEKVHTLRDMLPRDVFHAMALPFENVHFGGKNHDYWYLQVVHERATKIKALQQLVIWLGIPCRHLVAVGDNYNDAEMIAQADVGVAMGNAPAEIQALADVVVASNNDSGLSQVVDRILLSEQYFPESD